MKHQYSIVYPLRKIVPYKQRKDYAIFLCKSMGLLHEGSSIHFYLIHGERKFKTQTEYFFSDRICRHYMYIPRVFWRMKYAIAFFRILKTKIKGENIFLLHNTFHQTLLHAALKLFGFRSLFSVSTLHHYMRGKIKNYIIYVMELIHFRLADRIVVISKGGWKYVPKKFHNKTVFRYPNFLIDSPQIHTVASTTPYQIKHKAICLSRLEVEKGVLGLINGWRFVKPEWKLDIYGDGSLKQEVLDAIQKNGLHDQVIVHEPIRHSKIFKLLKNYDVFVLTSPCEGLGMAYLEAIYVGLPAVGLQVPGASESLDEGRGVLLPSKNWETLLQQALYDAALLRDDKQWYARVNKYFEDEIIPHLNTNASQLLK